jgi:hypothetical protein
MPSWRAEEQVTFHDICRPVRSGASIPLLLIFVSFRQVKTILRNSLLDTHISPIVKGHVVPNLLCVAAEEE